MNDVFEFCIFSVPFSSCQTPIVRDYPAHLSMTAFTYALGALQLAIVAVCIERDLSVWASTFYSDIPAVLYGVRT
jgi:hypothetical protein